jgi:hypothetical protein
VEPAPDALPEPLAAPEPEPRAVPGFEVVLAGVVLAGVALVLRKP